MKEKIQNLILDQFRQGTSAKKLALTVAAGGTLAVFPILGSTTLICLAVAAWFKLNQPLMQLINYMMYPLQILLIPAFIRAGEFIFNAEPMPFSVPEALAFFKNDPSHFLQKFGLCGVYSVAAWALVAVPVFGLIYSLVHPALNKLSQRRLPS